MRYARKKSAFGIEVTFRVASESRIQSLYILVLIHRLTTNAMPNIYHNMPSKRLKLISYSYDLLSGETMNKLRRDKFFYRHQIVQTTPYFWSQAHKEDKGRTRSDGGCTSHS